jgi:predicted O-methyltransferase YrrM
MIGQDLLRQLVFDGEKRLHSYYLAELLPGAADVTASVRMDVRHDWELPYGERSVLDAIVRLQQPRTVFEFGTFTGATTRLLAEAAPNATIHTIDLPPEALRSLGIEDVVSREFAGTHFESRIVQHRANTAAFDFDFLAGGVDIVFVDASHDYDEVVADSERAIEMLAPDGVVVWDDYHPRHPGVVRALNEVNQQIPLVSIARTRFAVYFSGDRLSRLLNQSPGRSPR